LEKPAMTRKQVIDRLREDIAIHERWIKIVTEHPSYARSFGDVDWHKEWIEVFRHAIWYLEPDLTNIVLSLDYVVDKLDEVILIHEGWAAYVTEHPRYATSFGDYDFHIGWIEVYRNVIYYLKQEIGKLDSSPFYDSVSKYKEVKMTRSKWTSRKFWTAIIGEVVGIVSIIWGASVASEVSTIAGAVILIATTLGYLKVEGDVDKANKGK
jgi:hypothetical protein